MNTNLFRFALEKIEAWQDFEKLSSAFLIAEFPGLRTMANPLGDGGRDSELFSPDGKPFVMCQYSIQKNWSAKIRQTVRRLKEAFPGVHLLVYSSNQLIGGQADDLKAELLNQEIVLDVRDRNWFLERAEQGESRLAASEELVERVARPILSGEQIINKPSSPLTSQEARAALLYLDLQLQDDVTAKGLTKLSFDALIRAALRHTTSEKRMSRDQIYGIIGEYLPSTNKEELKKQIDSALARLAKRFLRYWPKDDEFCLTYEESQRIIIRLAEKEAEESVFSEQIEVMYQPYLKDIRTENEEDLKIRIPRVIEKLLLRRGELFVVAVMSGNLERVGLEQLNDCIMSDIASNPLEGAGIQHYPEIIQTIICNLFKESTDSTRLHLRRLNNSYTLFSFLRETPDIQNATQKLFSHGKIWLDTTVILPLFSERLQEEELLRKFSRLVLTARDSGIELRVTPGVIQEVNAHMNYALSCCSQATWRGHIPFLYAQYLLLGKSKEGFSKWLTLFRGKDQPDEDIAQFLLEVFGIQRESLSEASKRADRELRYAADRLWTNVHYLRRRATIKDGDDAATKQLIEHDIETYLGVVTLRNEEQVTELGYKHWLLTLDRNAWSIRDALKEEFKKKTLTSPLLSLDFLLNNLTFGPKRSMLTKEQEQTLPIFLDIELTESMPVDILQIADKVRSDNLGLPEYVISRKVRDAINQFRRR